MADDKPTTADPKSIEGGLLDKAKSALGLGGKPDSDGGSAPGFWTSLASGNLTKNPLGIIGLFIGLIYGFASLLLTVAAGRLTHDERMPLIWFIVGFPVLVLAAFYRLVTAHPEKLYAPEDFKDDQSFLQALDPRAARQRTQEKLDTAEATDAAAKEGAGAGRPTSLDLGRSFLGPNPAPTQAPDAVDVLMHVQELALKRVEKDLGAPVRRQVSFGDGKQTAFDGVMVRAGEITAIEVKLFSRLLAPAAIRETITRSLLAREKLKTAHRRGSDLSLCLVLVTERDNTWASQCETQATDMAKAADLPIQVKRYAPEDLTAV